MLPQIQFYAKRRAAEEERLNGRHEPEQVYVEEYHSLTREEKGRVFESYKRHREKLPLAKDWVVEKPRQDTRSSDRKIRMAGEPIDILTDTLFLIVKNSVQCFFQKWENKVLNHMKILRAHKELPDWEDLPLFRLGFFNTQTSVFSYVNPITQRLSENPRLRVAPAAQDKGEKVAALRQMIMDNYVGSYVRSNSLRWGESRVSCLSDYALFTPRAKEKWALNYKTYNDMGRGEEELGSLLLEGLSDGKAVVVQITDCIKDEELHAIFARVCHGHDNTLVLECIDSLGPHRGERSVVSQIEMMWGAFTAKFFKGKVPRVHNYGIQNVDNNTNENVAELSCWYTAMTLTVVAVASGMSAQNLDVLFNETLKDKQWWVNYIVYMIRLIANELPSTK